MSFARDWLESNPVDHSKFKTQPGSVREFKVDISDRLKDFLYGFISGETDVGAKTLPFISQGTAGTPSTAANKILMFGSDAPSKVEIWIIDEDGNLIQLTKAGKIPVESLAITSGTSGDIFYIDGTGDIARLPKATDGQRLQLASGLPAWADTKRSPFWYIDGTLGTGSAQSAKLRVPFAGTIVAAYAYVDTAPTGASILVDINKNGSSIWGTSPGSRLAIAASGTQGSQSAFDVTSIAEGDNLTMDIDQVGSTVAGSDLTIVLVVKE